jgi:hypothetical protein
VVSGSTRVLIDAGFSAREIRRRLESIGEDISRIDAIVVQDPRLHISRDAEYLESGQDDRRLEGESDDLG